MDKLLEFLFAHTGAMIISKSKCEITCIIKGKYISTSYIHRGFDFNKLPFDNICMNLRNLDALELNKFTFYNDKPESITDE